MKYHYSSVLILAASFAAFSQLSAQTTWSGGGSTDNWSDSDNWVGGSVPNDNTKAVDYGQNGSVNFVIDQDFTINSFRDLFSGENETTTFSGPGVLTIDRNLSGASDAIQNATGGDGGHYRRSSDD